MKKFLCILMTLCLLCGLVSFAAAETKTEKTPKLKITLVSDEDTGVETLVADDTTAKATALRIKEIRYNKKVLTTEETARVRVMYTGGKKPWKVRYKLYVNGQYYKTSSWKNMGSTGNCLMKAEAEEPLNFYVIWQVKDAKGKVVSKKSARVYFADPLEVSCSADAVSVDVGDEIKWTAKVSGGEEPYKYLFTLQQDGVDIDTGTWTTSNKFTYTTDDVGSYRVKLKVKDTRGRTKQIYSSYVVVSAAAGTKYRCFLVGQKYSAPNTLYGCVNDRDAMAQVLESMTKTKYKGYLGTNLTASEILSGISSSFAGATDEDVSLFYYSGHGATDGSLCGANLTAGDYISPTQLRNKLDTIPGKKIVLIDACHSGNMIGKNADKEAGMTAHEKALSFTNNFISAFSRNNKSDLATDGYYVLVACRGDQTSSELGNNDHSIAFGVFTYFLTEGCGYDEANKQYTGKLPVDANGDKKVTLSEAYNYVTARLKVAHQLFGFSDPFEQVTQVYPYGSNQMLFAKK